MEADQHTHPRRSRWQPLNLTTLWTRASQAEVRMRMPLLLAHAAFTRLLSQAARPRSTILPNTVATPKPATDSNSIVPNTSRYPAAPGM